MGRGFEPTRAVEITHPKYGSGYRIGGSLVLTAAHLVPPSVGEPCKVRFRSDAGGAEWDATVVWLAPGWDGPDARADRDVALIALSDDAETCEPAMFGRLPHGLGALRLDFELFGWPRWGQTVTEGGQTLAGGRHVDGVIYPADTSGEGLLVLEPSRRPDPAGGAAAGSEWMGLSGAAVLCDGLIIGVQRHHQNPRRSGSLEAVALERFAEDMDLRRLLDQAGIEAPWPTPTFATSALSGALRSIAGVGQRARETRVDLPSPLEPQFPPVTPAVESDEAFGVPLYPTKYFAGRSEALQELEDTLASRMPPHFVVITGDAGVGKTQLAVEYAYQHRDAYEVIWWVRAARSETLVTDFADLAAQGPLASDPRIAAGSSVDDTARAVRAWLERNDRWLLVFDNANSFDDISALLPRGDGHVVVTSRRDVEWGPIASELLLEVLDPASAAALLLRRSGQNDEQAAADLAGELGYLPLALEQAGSFIAQTAGFSLAQYLTTFRKRSSELLARGKPFGYEGTVSTTWDLAFEHLREASPNALELLDLFAFFAPEDIPTTAVFTTLIEVDAEQTSSDEEERLDALVLADAAAALRAYGLVRGAGDGDGVFVHRLLQAVVRASLETDEQEWAGVALAVIGGALSSSLDGVGSDGDRLASHALIAAAHAERLDVDGQLVSGVLDLVGKHFLARGHYPQAVSVLQRALALDVGMLPEDDPTPAVSKSSLGVALWRQGDLAQARILLQEALALGNRLMRTDDPNLATMHGNLGLVLHAQGELAAARAEFERALALGELTLGQPDLALAHSNLGGVLQAQGELAAARAEFERAIALGEQALGPDHRNLVLPHSNLGGVLQAQGELAAARAEFERAIALGEQTLGPDHPSLVVPHSNLGMVFQAQGELAAARVEYERAIALGERTLSPDHPDLVVPHSNLGMVFQAQGELAAAQAEFERAIALGEQTLGLDHPSLVVPRSNLGWVLQAQGKSAAARAELERAIALGERTLGSDHPSLVRPRSNLGDVLLAQGELTAARIEAERAIALGERTLGPDHPDLIAPRTNLAKVLEAQGDAAAARAVLEHTIALAEQRPGRMGVDVAYAQDHLGALKRAGGDALAAKTAHEHAVAIKEAIFGPDHPQVGSSLHWLALAEAALGELDRARSHIERTVAIQTAVHGPDAPGLTSPLQTLGDVQRRAGDTVAARQAYRRALQISEATLEPNDVQLGYVHSRLARAERDLGNLGAARDHFIRDLAIARAAPDPDDWSVGNALAELGGVERNLGLDRHAQQTLGEAIDLLSKLGPTPTLVAALRGHAQASAAIGDLASAKTSLEWALAACGARSQDDDPAAAILQELRPILARLDDTTTGARPATTAPGDARDWIFALRRAALEGEDIRALLEPSLEDVFADTAAVRHSLEAWNAKEAELGTELIREVERYLVFEVVDGRWQSAHESSDLAVLVRREFLRLLFTVTIETEDAESKPSTH